MKSRHANESLVEVLDSFESLVGCPIAHEANFASRNELCVGDWAEARKVLLEVGLCDVAREACM